MITLIRKSFKSKAYRIVMWVTLAAIAGVFSLPELFKRISGGDRWVASVNSCYIDYKDFARRASHYEQRMQMLREQYGPYADMLMRSMGMGNDPKKEALNSLIGDQLLNDIAHKLNIHIDDSYVALKLNDPRFVMRELSDIIPMFLLSQKTGKIDQEKLMMYLRKNGISLEEFEASVEKQLRKHLVLELIGGGAYVPHFILKDAYKNTLPKKFSILTFSFDTILGQEKKKEIGEKDLKSFYDKHMRSYAVPEKRNGIKWNFSPLDFGIDIADADIKAYYNSHKLTKFIKSTAQIQIRSIFIKGKEGLSYQKAQKALESIKQDSSKFAQVAQEFSEDAASAKAGGLLPWFKRGEKNKAVERAAFGLKDDGAVSGVITADDGLYIVQRVAKKMPEYKELSGVYQEIKTLLTNQKFNEAFVREARAAIEASKADRQAFENFVAAKKGKRQETGLLEKNTDSFVAQALFRLKEHGMLALTEKGQGLIVELAEIKKSYTPALEEIKATVQQDWYREQAARTLKSVLKEAKKEAATLSLDQIKSKFGGSLETTGLIVKDAAILEGLKKRGVPVELMFSLEKVGAVATFDTQTHGYFIKLEEQAPFQEQAFKESKKALEQDLSQQYASLVADGFVASLYRNATITSNDSLLKTPEE